MTSYRAQGGYHGQGSGYCCTAGRRSLGRPWNVPPATILASLIIATSPVLLHRERRAGIDRRLDRTEATIEEMGRTVGRLSRSMDRASSTCRTCGIGSPPWRARTSASRKQPRSCGSAYHASMTPISRDLTGRSGDRSQAADDVDPAKPRWPEASSTLPSRRGSAGVWSPRRCASWLSPRWSPARRTGMG